MGMTSIDEWKVENAQGRLMGGLAGQAM